MVDVLRHLGVGTPQALTDDNQTVVWQGDYDPFGKATETVATVEQNLRFPGQYLDRESGLHYNYFRTYDPGTGRYTQSDPIGLGGGINTYGYADQNPVTIVDPYGLFGMDSVYSAIYKTTGWIPSQETTDRAAGFGDGFSRVFTFGYFSTADLRKEFDIDGVDECSADYIGSQFAGNIAGGLALGGAIRTIGVKSFRPGGWLNSNRYLRIGWGRHKGNQVFRISGKLVKNKTGHFDLFKGKRL